MRAAVVVVFLVALLLLPLVARCDCDCSPDEDGRDKKKARPLKIAAIFSILLCSAIGVCLPSLGKWVPSLRPENDIFFVIKAFAAGVILATGFIHILPDAFDQLTSPCLSEKPWQDFPFAGFTAMVAAMATLMIDTLATGYFKRLNSGKAMSSAPDMAVELAAKGSDVEDVAVRANAVRVHAHATHGHAHGVVASEDDAYGQLIRHRVIAQVLELGIIVHSVIIGISLGAMEKPSAIRPLLVALCFHQFFEGIGLGGCIAQASLKLKSTVIMAIFFSCTTPVGIAIGMGISSVYNENSPTALIVEGLLDSAAGGILIYMALVDLLAEDFMNPRVQTKGMLQLGINISLLMGSGLMSLLAKWA